jgi:hypothetical protein
LGVAEQGVELRGVEVFVLGKEGNELRERAAEIAF